MELRVHGIGGPTAESVLGRVDGDRAVASWRSAPSARSAVRRARGDHGVHAYHWAPLTSGSRSFALWPLLLPFTLVNVSGWMHPAATGGWRTAQAAAARVGVALLGLALTAGTVVWLVLAGVVLARHDGLLPAAVLRWLPGGLDEARLLAGLVGAAAALALLVAASTYTARGYERYRRPSWEAAPARPRRRAWQPRRAPDLADERFFDDADDHRWRWAAHLLAAVAVFAALAAALAWQGPGDPAAVDEVLGGAVLLAGAVQGALLGVLVVVALPAGPRGLLLPATATVGVMLAGGFTLSTVVALAGLAAVPPGAPGMLYDAYGWAIGAAVLVAVATVALRLATPVPAEAHPRRDEVLGTLAARLRARLALVPGGLGPAVVVLALTFLAVGATFAGTRLGDPGWDAWRLTSTAPVRLAQLTLVALLGAVVVNLWKSRAHPAALRRVGNLWDVLTFWPRSYHPFAVRPYAERAVPELREHLCGLPRDAPLVVTAHSQGSVLAYAALLPLATGRSMAGRVGPTALVTVGSPLRSLYAVAFPHYVRAADVQRLRRSLEPGGWTNLFRYTDHVGRALFSRAAHPLDDPGDVVVPEPAAGGRVRGHDRYWDDPAVREAVRAGRDRLAATAAARGSGSVVVPGRGAANGAGGPGRDPAGGGVRGPGPDPARGDVRGPGPDRGGGVTSGSSGGPTGGSTDGPSIEEARP